MSQDGEKTPPPAIDNGEGAAHTASPTPSQQDEPPSHQPDPASSPSHSTLSPSPPTSQTSIAQLPSTQHLPANRHSTPAPEIPGRNNGVAPNQMANGTSQSQGANIFQADGRGEPDPTETANGVDQDTSMTNAPSEITNSAQNGYHEDVEPTPDQLGSPRDALDDYDWQELEERFAARMKECEAREEELGREFKEWVEVFKAWASVTEIHEEERASKRLRTRITYVQQREKKLEGKREHYIKVIEAFESLVLELPADLPSEHEDDDDIEYGKPEVPADGDIRMEDADLPDTELSEQHTLAVAPPGRWRRCTVM